MSLRGPVPTPTPKARRAEFTDEMDGKGWDWMDGVSKVSFNSLLLCVYKDHVYIHLYMQSKIVTKILMGFKI